MSCATGLHTPCAASALKSGCSAATWQMDSLPGPAKAVMVVSRPCRADPCQRPGCKHCSRCYAAHQCDMQSRGHVRGSAVQWPSGGIKARPTHVMRSCIHSVVACSWHAGCPHLPQQYCTVTSLLCSPTPTTGDCMHAAWVKGSRSGKFQSAYCRECSRVAQQYSNLLVGFFKRPTPTIDDWLGGGTRHQSQVSVCSTDSTGSRVAQQDGDLLVGYSDVPHHDG